MKAFELQNIEKAHLIHRNKQIGEVLESSTTPLWDLVHEYKDNNDRIEAIEHAEQQRLTSV